LNAAMRGVSSSIRTKMAVLTWSWRADETL
jgi:hypothetical protein